MDATEGRKISARDYGFLRALSEQMGLMDGADEVLTAASRLVGEYLGANRCYFAEGQEGTGQIVVHHDWRAPSLDGNPAAGILANLGQAGWHDDAAGGLFSIDDIETDPRLVANRNEYRTSQVRSFASATVLRPGRRRVLLAVTTNRRRNWRADELALLEDALARVWPVVERERSHAVLRANLRQLRNVTDHMPVYIAQFDRSLRFTFVNRNYAEFLQRDANSLVGRRLDEVLAPATHDLFRNRIDAALGGARVEFEQDISSDSAGACWVVVNLVPEKTTDGEVTGVLAVMTDISARKRAERDALDARDHLLAATRATDDFLATVSHELRAPLNPVLLLASEGAENTEFPPSVRNDFATIRSNVELEARLIDDLLDLTRISCGKLALERGLVDVHAVVRDIIALVGGEAEQKQIELALSLEAVNPWLEGDAVRLHQVFWHLLKNAIKFTPQHGCITVRSSTEEPSGPLIVTISDTGVGITRAELERIFEPFAQGDFAGEAGRLPDGLGLGLALARMLVQLHSGSIRASSDGRGLGSTFVLELPVTAAMPRVEAAAPPTKSPARREGTNPTRVLLVEDHAATREALANLLRRRNFEVVAAGSLAEARQLAAEGGFSLLVSDVGLPDGSGCDLMSELRERFGLKGIALTGYGMEEDVMRSERAGFSAHLTKPVRVQSLERALAAVLPADLPAA